MSRTRRGFLQSAATVAAGLANAASAAKTQGQSQTQIQSGAAVQVPKVRFGKAEISRLVIGSNPFLGVSHTNGIMDSVLREWYTPGRVVEVLLQCNKYGINSFQYVHSSRCQADYERLQAEGGNMHLIALANRVEPEAVIKAIKPLALYYHGELSDREFQNGNMTTAREWTKKVRQTGVLVGVGTHKPEVIAKIEEENWDIDFYLGCVYNRTRTPDEFRKLLGGELPLPANDVYLEGDPARMYKVMRQTKRTCFPFKILAAGRVPSRPETLDQAFRTAFESIKPNDCVIVGMFPRIKDEVKENAERVHRILTRA
jgi:hypothetical protein